MVGKIDQNLQTDKFKVLLQHFIKETHELDPANFEINFKKRKKNTFIFRFVFLLSALIHEK